jgi:hypothetical protein
MSPRPPQADEPRSDPGRPERPDRDERLGSALSDLPVPDHGPTFWADLDHRLQGDTVPHTESATDAGPDQPTLSTPALTTPTTGPAAVSLDERRDRRAARRGGGRFTRSLGAAAAAVALVVAAAGALTVVNRDDKTDREVRAADRPGGRPGGPGARRG